MGTGGKGGEAPVDRLTGFGLYIVDGGGLAYGLGYLSPSEGIAAAVV
jgi:hypothetical protein